MCGANNGFVVPPVLSWQRLVSFGDVAGDCKVERRGGSGQDNCGLLIPEGRSSERWNVRKVPRYLPLRGRENETGWEGGQGGASNRAKYITFALSKRPGDDGGLWGNIK